MKFLIMLILTLIVHSFTSAQVMGPGFNYQGEILDNGSPANGDYDIIINAFDTQIGGSPIAVSDIRFNIAITNGLLNIENIDFLSSGIYHGDLVWMEIGIKKSSDPFTSFETLTPRQSIGAVPNSIFSYRADYAVGADFSAIAYDLGIGVPITNDVLTYNGTRWYPKANTWIEQTPTRLMTNHKVGIGDSSVNAKLTIKGDTGTNSMEVKNSGNEIGLVVHSNSGVSIGSSFIPDVSEVKGLYVYGNVTQGSTANGIMKYMVRVQCLASGSNIISSYPNYSTNSPIFATDENTTGGCSVHFPTNINTRYWQVTAVSDNGNHNANCHTVVSNNVLKCQRTLSGANSNGDIMILVY